MSEEPPVAVANQLTTSPDAGIAESPTVPGPQPEPFTPVGGFVILTVAVTARLEEEIQPEVVFLASA